MYKYHNRARTLDIFRQLTKQRQTKVFLDILKAHHRETYEHSLRVAKLSIDLTLENGFPITVGKLIGRAALLHDFGKTKIDEKILSKQGSLSREEILEVSKHPRVAAFMLKKHLSPIARKIIIAHHEFKAKPYPRKALERRRGIRVVEHDRRRRNLINTFTQIVAAADMYDALSFSRSYKGSYPIEKVRQIMIEEFIGKPLLIEQLAEKPIRIVGTRA